MTLDKRNLYRFPWSLNDNPIGWVEVTDACNISCVGCYRRQVEGHKPLESIKEEILFMKRWRNVDNISIAGGEPLVHPQILDIIAFISEQRLKPFTLTNGLKVDKPLLVELKRAGLVGIGYHIDSQQTRKDWTGKNEIELCELRQHYADLTAEVHLPTGFGITVHRSNLQYVPDLIRWTIRNRHKVQAATFITYRSGLPEGVTYRVDGREVEITNESLNYMPAPDEVEDTSITSIEVYELIKQHFPEYEASAYLGGTQDHESFKWLAGVMVATKDGRILGSLGKKTVELAQAGHHFFKGTYMVYSSDTQLGKKLFLLSPFDPEVRTMLKKFMRKPWQLLYAPVYGIAIGIVQAPDLLSDGRVDMCDSCPDMTYYNGRLVNSCRLDEYRLFGQLVTPVPQKREGLEGSGSGSPPT